MRMSESMANIGKALAAFQSEVQDPAKNSDNPFFKSKYVELDDLLKATRPVLAKHGLSVLQEPTSQDGQTIAVKTILLHSSGEWIEFEPLTLKAVKADPQGAGSAITYGRRYALSSVLGVAWDADDDANKASGKDIKATPKETKQEDKQESNVATEIQRKKLYSMCKEQCMSADDMKALLKWKFGVDSSKDLSKQQASEAIEKLAEYWVQYVAEQSKAS